MTRRVLIAMLIGLAVCRDGKPPSPGPSSSGSQPSALSERARIVLEGPCGQCHIGSYPTSLPGALAVFDLGEADWFLRMTEAQLLDADHRLGEPLPPDGAPNPTSPADRDLFHSFVLEEIEERKTTPP